MKTRLFSAAAVATLLAPSNLLGPIGDPAKTAAPAPVEVAAVARLTSSPLLKLQPESRLWLEGGSTVRSYKCEATEVYGEVWLDSDRQVDGLAGLAGIVKEAGITVPVEQLDCNNGTMNDHMRKALNAKDHETIEYQLDGFEIVDAAEGEAGPRVEMRGRLTISGTELPIEFPAAIEVTGEGVIRLEGQVELDMTRFGVKPPRLMLGTLKVHDEVTVHFDVVFRS